jgi:hypothetical protein
MGRAGGSAGSADRGRAASGVLVMSFTRRAVPFALAALTLARAAAADADGGAGPLFRIRRGGKWGYVDRSGQIVVSPRFDAAGPFSEGLAPVRSGETFGYIDPTGRMVLVPAYSPAGRGLHRPFSNGLAVVRKGDLQGYIDRSGALTIPARFDWADDFSEGLASTCDRRGCEYVGRDGAPVLSPGLMGGERFHGGVAGVSAGMGMGRGRMVLFSLHRGRLPGEYEAIGNLSQGLIPVALAGAWGYVDERGVPVIRLLHAWAGDFAEGLAPVKDGSGRCGYIDREGRIAIPVRYRACGVFSSGRARVDLAASASDAERVAFVDREGKVVFEGASASPPFLRAEDFVDGLAAVGVGGDPQLVGHGPLLGYVDPDGRYVWAPAQ